MLPADPEFEYEEISPAEVARIVAALKALEASVASQTIREFLEDCSTNIHYLVNDDDEAAWDAAA